MAQGDWTPFNALAQHIAEGVHGNLNTATLKLAIIRVATTPAATDADPHFGGTGTTNLATNEAATAGTYTAGGTDVVNSGSLTSNVYTIDGTTNPTWAAHASNSSDVAWGILYNDTIVSKKAIGFVDLGGSFDWTAGELTVTWDASGILTVTVT